MNCFYVKFFVFINQLVQSNINQKINHMNQRKYLINQINQ